MKISLFLEQKTVIMSNVKDLIGVNTFERPMDSTNLQFRTNPGFFMLLEDYQQMQCMMYLKGFFNTVSKN